MARGARGEQGQGGSGGKGETGARGGGRSLSGCGEGEGKLMFMPVGMFTNGQSQYSSLLLSCHPPPSFAMLVLNLNCRSLSSRVDSQYSSLLFFANALCHA